MKYTLQNTQLIEKYKKIYLEAEREKIEKKCLMGTEAKYRISIKDSYFDNISDTDSIFEYCLYPLYMDGDTDIKIRIQKMLLEMASSDDVLEIFQVYNFIISQDILCKIYSEIPFVIDFSSIIETLLKYKDRYEQKMKEYKENGFDRYKESLWDNVERIQRKSNTIKRYMEEVNNKM